METAKKILIKILKNPSIQYTVTSIAKEIESSRVSAWKILKKMEADKLINLKQFGNGKTSMYTLELNWSNVLTEKNLEIVTIEESQNNQRWLDNFKELEKEVDFLILFGSVLHSPKDANDIDILIVSNKKNITKINEIILKIQKSQVKKIHSTNLTKIEFKKEVQNQNKIFMDAIRKGVVLFGQKNFINMIKELKK